MICPHCLTAIYAQWDETNLGLDNTGRWSLHKTSCPKCGKFILSLCEHEKRGGNLKRRFLVYPKAPNRSPLSEDVPDKYATDYEEACLVLSDSPKASAALSRRCLQHILRDEYKVKKADLAIEIQQVIDENKLPSHILESLDAIRNIGNFAAHPIKSTKTGEIIEVEPGEAEWNLDVLESLFDYYFVQPANVERKRNALNAKLKEAGKPEMKKP